MGEHPLTWWLTAFAVAILIKIIFSRPLDHLTMPMADRIEGKIHYLTGKFTHAILRSRKETGMTNNIYGYDDTEASLVLKRKMSELVDSYWLREPPLNAYTDRYGGQYFRTETRYNTGQENLMETQALYEIFIINRDKAATDPIGSVTCTLIAASNPEAARTAVAIEKKLTVADLQVYLIASREVCRIPYLPRQDRLLPDNGGVVQGKS